MAFETVINDKDGVITISPPDASVERILVSLHNDNGGYHVHRWLTPEQAQKLAAALLAHCVTEEVTL